MLAALGIDAAALRARAKLLESFPDRVRATFAATATRFVIPPSIAPTPDPRIAALAGAIRDGSLVRLRSRSARPLLLRPTALTCTSTGWLLQGAPSAPPVPQQDWGDINIARSA